MFFATAESETRVEGAIDEYGDSFARDTTVDELREVRGVRDQPIVLIAHLLLACQLDAYQVRAQLQCQDLHKRA